MSGSVLVCWYHLVKGTGESKTEIEKAYKIALAQL